MSEMRRPPQGSALGTPRPDAGDGAARCYVRLAVLGDRGRARRWTLQVGGWPDALADLVRDAHDVSLCDASSAGATAYDIRRVQLRVAVAHRPHLVALDAGLGELGRRDFDVSGIRSHLAHVAAVLATRGAVLVTTGVAGRTPWHRSRADQLDAVYTELAARFGTVHVEASHRAPVVAERVADALRARGLAVGRIGDAR